MAVVLTAEQESVAQQGLRKRIERMRDTVEPFLPREVTFEQMMWGALLAAMGNSEIYECSSSSLLTSLVQAVQTGLTLGKTVFLVPFKDGDAPKKKCTMIVHYKGYVELAIATGQVQSVFANVVRHGEQFEVWGGTEPRIVHRVGWKESNQPIVASYAVAVMRGGAVVSEVMSLEQIEAVRKTYSRKWNKGPLPPWWAKKAPVRQLQKYLPQTAGLYLANRYDERPGELLTMEQAAEAMASDNLEGAAQEPDAPAVVGTGRRQASRLILPAGSRISAMDGVPSRTARESREPALVGEVRGFAKPSARDYAEARAVAPFAPRIDAPPARPFVTDARPFDDDEDPDGLPF